MFIAMTGQEVQICRYEPRHADAWRDLNEAWLTKYFAIEDKDRLVLGNPDDHILASGGAIFMAEIDDKPVGCCALIRMDDGGYELGKMAVSEAAQRRGIARKLMLSCIAFARAANASRIYLETNSVLTPAITLYESCGFRHIPRQPSPYVRCDTWMELKL